MDAANSTENVSLLIADDDADDLELMESAFREAGYHLPIRSFPNGICMLEFLLARAVKSPVLVILDLNMPKQNGKIILDRIRKNPELSEVLVIVYSTSKSSEDILEAYRLGCNAYIVKPNCYNEIRKIAAGIKRLWFDANDLIKRRLSLSRI